MMRVNNPVTSCIERGQVLQSNTLNRYIVTKCWIARPDPASPAEVFYDS
jgi:hypothetical protein